MWRMDSQKTEGEAEMREILTDWYDLEMHGMNREKATKRLVDVLCVHSPSVGNTMKETQQEATSCEDCKQRAEEEKNKNSDLEQVKMRIKILLINQHQPRRIRRKRKCVFLLVFVLPAFSSVAAV